MPIYEFSCKKCGEVTEDIVTVSTDTIKCPKCGSDANKIMSSSSFVINGYSEKNGYSKRARR